MAASALQRRITQLESRYRPMEEFNSPPETLERFQKLTELLYKDPIRNAEDIAIFEEVTGHRHQ